MKANFQLRSIMTLEIPGNSTSEPSAATQTDAQSAPNEGDPNYRRILVPIDFSEHSKKTIFYATSFAARFNATVQLLHVFEIPDYAGTPYGRQPQACNQYKSQVD